MGSCALSHDGNIVSCGDKKIQIGITTIRWGDFRFKGNEAKHNTKINEIKRMIGVDNYIRIIPKHDPKVTHLKEKLNISKIIEGDAIIHNPNQWVFLAMVHCSWKTLQNNIIENCFRHITKPHDLKAVIYRGICQEHYEVGQDVVNAFIRKDEKYKKHFSDSLGKTHFDLSGLILEKIVSSGIKKENINCVNTCSVHSTFSNFSGHIRNEYDKNRAFYSYRYFGDAKRNLIFTKLNGLNFFIASTTGNCPYVILYKH